MATHFHTCGKEVDVQTHWAGTHYVSRFLDPDDGSELAFCACGEPLHAALGVGALAERLPEKIQIGPVDIT